MNEKLILSVKHGKSFILTHEVLHAYVMFIYNMIKYLQNHQTCFVEFLHGLAKID